MVNFAAISSKDNFLLHILIIYNLIADLTVRFQPNRQAAKLAIHEHTDLLIRQNSAHIFFFSFSNSMNMNQFHAKKRHFKAMSSSE
jgi:hypothetical protein